MDVLVVGGGITGLTTAYLLRRAGMSVALVERDRIARVDTAHTTAHLTTVTDTRLSDLVEQFGRDHARAVWDAGAAAIEQIEEITSREKIECEFTHVPGYLHTLVEGGTEPDRQTLISQRCAPKNKSKRWKRGGWTPQGRLCQRRSCPRKHER